MTITVGRLLVYVSALLAAAVLLFMGSTWFGPAGRQSFAHKAQAICRQELPAIANAPDSQTALTQSLGQVFALMENYPDLKSNQNVLNLQEELTGTESRIAFARQYYNDLVTQYNTKQQVFPSNMIAGFFRFQPSELFSVPEAEKALPKVDLRLRS